MLIADTSNFLVPNATFIVELVLFVIVLGIVARVALPPLIRVLQDRRETIQRGIEEGEQAHQLLLQAAAEYDAKVEEGRLAARAEVEASTRAGEQLRDETRQRAATEYEAIVSEARARIAEESERVSSELLRELPSLVVGTARKVLDGDPPPEMRRALEGEAAGEVRSSA